MKNYLCLTLALLVCATAGNRAADDQSITPVDAGLAGGLIEIVNNFGGDQTDPHVSGNLASYTDFGFGAGVVRYFDMGTGIDSPIPNEFPPEVDTLSSVNGTRIAFSRQLSDRTATILFDTVTNTFTELDPQPGSLRLATAIGGSRVAWVDGHSGSGDIVVHNLDSNDTANLSRGVGANGSPNVAPDGNSVVWHSCNVTITQCDIYAASWVGAWDIDRVNETSGDLNLNADTDGTYLVYQSGRPSTTDQDIYIVAGGVERRLAIPGIQRNPSLDQGVVSFESKQSGSTPSDMFVYVIATNRLYQVTSTVGIDESVSDVSVLPNHDVRVVWAANDGPAGAQNIYVATFTPGSVLAIDNVSAVEGDGGTSPFTFTVSLLPAGTHAATVGYTTADGDAVANGDYIPTSGTLTFAAGETSRSITVDVKGDTDFEGDEIFTVVLSNPSNAIVSVNHGIATGTIQNDDASDTTPPDTTITALPSGPPSRTGTFQFTSTELNSTFECQLDAGAFAACASPQTYTGLANGDHTFRVRAIDTAGNIDQSPASHTWSVAIDTYSVCLLYDPSVAKKAGSTYLIKLQLCDASGSNLSSASIPLHAVGVTRMSNAAPGPLDDTGNANPDSDFRYHATLQGYVFNLSLKCRAGLCFTTGTYTMNFTAGSGTTLYSAGFAVK